MPRKKKEVVEPPTPEEEDDAGVGFPNHGDEAPDDNPPDPGEVREPAPPAPQVDPAMTALKEQLAETNRKLDELRRMTPPPTPRVVPTEEAGPDYEKLLFDDPKAAVKLIKAEAVAEATSKLRGEYQREQGTVRFWDQFFEANNDLKREDQDLIETVLNKNFTELANIPVGEAYKKLGDLTRDRILRYAGKKPTKTAKVEGADPPTPPRAPPETAEVTTLSDIIRARNAKRRASAA